MLFQLASPPKGILSLAIGVSICLMAATESRSQQNSPQWRGPNRDGMAAPQKLLKAWPQSGPKLAWSFSELGRGYSSPSIVDGKLYTLGTQADRCVAICLDAKTGKLLWSTDIGNGKVRSEDYNADWGDGPRSTPTVEGDSVYVCSDLGTVACLDRLSGKVVWTKELVRDLGGKIPTWGYSDSPLVDGDRVLVTPGSQNFLVGLHKRSGDTVWKSQCNDDAQYASIIEWKKGNIKCYISASKQGLVAIDSSTGDVLFRNDKTGNSTAVIPTPLLVGNRLYHSSGYNTGNIAFDLSIEQGKLVAKQAFFKKSKESMSNDHGGYVVIENVLYGFTGSMRKVWMAQDFRTGDLLWKQKVGSGQTGSGSISAADGMLYCYDDTDGVCYLIEPSREKWNEKGKVTLPKTTSTDRKLGAIWAHPVIAEQKLFIRDQEYIFAFDIASP